MRGEEAEPMYILSCTQLHVQRPCIYMYIQYYVCIPPNVCVFVYLMYIHVCTLNFMYNVHAYIMCLSCYTCTTFVIHACLCT